MRTSDRNVNPKGLRAGMTAPHFVDAVTALALGGRGPMAGIIDRARKAEVTDHAAFAAHA
jgi:hypothetical protein